MIEHVSDDRWNHNIHYQRLVLRAVPPGCERALDVGCGDGLLSRALRDLVPAVTGIDLHGPSLERAKNADPERKIEYLRGDFMTHPFAPASFDLIGSVAALHHMDAAVALERMAALLRPGGRLVVIGLARSRSPRDLPFEIAGAVATRWHKRTKTYWEHSSPTVWPPALSYGAMRRLSRRLLPGSRFRRLAMWRYALVWTKPGHETMGG